MFCETLKSFKAVDLKETSMESLLWASNRQHLLKPVISPEVLEHLTVLGNNASRLNMVIVDTPEDGDCLFYSVAYGLQKIFHDIPKCLNQYERFQNVINDINELSFFV